MSKQRRKKMEVQSQQTDQREEFLSCSTPGCQNVVAAWTVPATYSQVFCSPCSIRLMESR